VNRWARALLVLVAAAVVFAVGVAVGEAVHDNPRPGHTFTIETTLRP
jgi:hypothetical protein